jgi:acetyl esterase
MTPADGGAAVNLDPQARAFLDVVAASNRPAIETMPLADARALFEETFTRLGGPPLEVGRVVDVEAPGPRGPIPIRVYTPQGEQMTRPLFVFFHGGGWVCGSRDSYDSVCRLLTRESGCVVASVDYRLAPEHPAPEPFEDCYAALEWLAEHAGELGADASRLGIGGDSAGGGLAANVALKARDAGGPKIVHQLLVYPATTADDVEHASYRSFRDGYFLTGDRIEFYYHCHIPRPEIVDVPYAIADRATSLRGLPPATIILAECDPIRDQGLDWANRLRADGVPVDVRVYGGMIHAFFSFIAIFDQGREAVTYAGREVGKALGAPASAAAG